MGVGFAKRNETNEAPLAQRRCAAKAFEILDVNCPRLCWRHAAFDRDMQVELQGFGGLPSPIALPDSCPAAFVAHRIAVVSRWAKH